MIRHITIAVLCATLLSGPALAGNSASPKLKAEVRDSAQVTKRNISKMKLKTSVLKRAEISVRDTMP